MGTQTTQKKWTVSEAKAATRNECTYSEWMQLVSGIIRRQIGVGYNDLPDLMCSRDSYDNGSTVGQFVQETIETMIEEGELPSED